jgi:hypothetical protein
MICYLETFNSPCVTLRVAFTAILIPALSRNCTFDKHSALAEKQWKTAVDFLFLSPDLEPSQLMFLTKLKSRFDVHTLLSNYNSVYIHITLSPLSPPINHPADPLQSSSQPQVSQFYHPLPYV